MDLQITFAKVASHAEQSYLQLAAVSWERSTWRKNFAHHYFFLPGIFVCVHLCVCVCVSVCWCFHVCEYMCVKLFVYVCMLPWMVECVCVCSCACVSLWVCAWVYVSVNVCFCVCLCVWVCEKRVSAVAWGEMKTGKINDALLAWSKTHY